jgi:hypothetical protein
VIEKQKTEIDAGLLEELRQRAREQSRTEGELLEAIARRYLVVAPGAPTASGNSSRRWSVADAKRASNRSPRTRRWSSPTRSCTPWGRNVGKGGSPRVPLDPGVLVSAAISVNGPFISVPTPIPCASVGVESDGPLDHRFRAFSRPDHTPPCEHHGPVPVAAPLWGREASVRGPCWRGHNRPSRHRRVHHQNADGAGEPSRGALSDAGERPRIELRCRRPRTGRSPRSGPSRRQNRVSKAKGCPADSRSSGKRRRSSPARTPRAEKRPADKRRDRRSPGHERGSDRRLSASNEAATGVTGGFRDGPLN